MHHVSFITRSTCAAGLSPWPNSGSSSASRAWPTSLSASSQATGQRQTASVTCTTTCLMRSTKISKNLKLTSFRFFVRLAVAAVIAGMNLRVLAVAAVIAGMNLRVLDVAAVIAGTSLADSRLAAVKTGISLADSRLAAVIAGISLADSRLDTVIAGISLADSRLDTVFMGTITVLIPAFY